MNPASGESGSAGAAGRCLLQDVQRLEDVEQKHERIRQLLKVQQADAVLLQ